MTFDTNDRNQLSQLTLVASDQAYAGTLLGFGADLAPYDDTDQYSNPVATERTNVTEKSALAGRR